MSFTRAVAFLWAASLRNRVRKQWERLKQPRYFLGALIGLGYVYFVLVRRFTVEGPSRGASLGAPLAIQALAAGSLLVTVASAWAVGADRPSISLSEGEVQNFLPAPITRRNLLHYKLLRGFAGGSLGVLFAAFFMHRVAGVSSVLFILGSLLSFAVVYLHITAASFVRTRLAEWGWRGTALRWSVLLLVLAAAAWGVRAALESVPLPVGVKDVKALQGWFTALLAQPTVGVMAWPVRVLVELPFSPDVETFLRRLLAPLGLLAAHYAWVMAMRVPFEESAVLLGEARASARATRLESHRAMGQGRHIRVRGAPFGLRPVGRPEVALLWKNMVAGWRLGTLHSFLWLMFFASLTQAVLMVFSPRHADLLSLTLVPLCGMFAVGLGLIGPSLFRHDLRMDLRKLDLLRSMPLRGWQVVAAELLAPVLMLTLLEVLLVLMTVVFGLGIPSAGEEGGLGTWVAGGLTAVLVLPAVSLANLFVQNAVVVLFPARFPADNERLRGIEALGQRLLTLLGTLLVLLVGLLPAAAVALAVGFGLHAALGLGIWALPFAGLAASGVLVGLVGFGVLGVGRVFDSLDISGEGPSLSGEGS